MMAAVTWARASIGRLVLLGLLAIGFVCAVPMSGAAQERAEVRGAADFRNPPRLVNGSYTDTIVSGEAVWYEVLYTNDTEFSFEVSLADVDVESSDELTLEAKFVGPTLGSVQSGTELSGSASYSGGDTNPWYLEVVLETTGRRGLQYTLLIDVEGVEDSTSDTCPDDPECTLDEDLATLDAELAELEAETVALAAESTEDLQAEIDALTTEADEVRAEAQTVQEDVAALCAPGTDCDTPPTTAETPLWATVAGVVALLAGLGVLAGTALRRR